MEDWVNIAGYDNYQVSSHGNVRNIRTGRVLKPSGFHKYGYQHVELRKNGVGRSIQVHRLVLGAFVGECPNGMECCHLDGNSTNNHIDNLRWGTCRENMADMVKHGTRVVVRGEAHVNAKLTNKQVIEIRNLRGTMPQCEIAKKFGISNPNLSHILSRKKWKHI